MCSPYLYPSFINYCSHIYLNHYLLLLFIPISLQEHIREEEEFRKEQEKKKQAADDKVRAHHIIYLLIS